MNLAKNFNESIINLGSKHTYKALEKTIEEYYNMLSDCKKNNINSVAIVTGEELNFNTICLVYALIKCGIKPILIDSKINEQINGILEKEKTNIVFYESHIRPKYLQNFNIYIRGEEEYDDGFITVNPNININDKNRIKSIKWALRLLASQKEDSNYICKLYTKERSNVIEEVITESDIINYNKNFDNLEETLKVQTTLPLYDKEGFLYLNGSLSKCMSITSFNRFDMEKNIDKILKYKPSIVTIDKYMALELITNEKYRNIDLSFIKKVVIDIEPYYMVSVINILNQNGFVGSYMALGQELDYQKVLEKNFEL
jgi:hypothetical protein